MTADFSKWFAFGTGVGIEIGREDATITVARVRPSGVTVLGELIIRKFRETPASEWGAEYSSFLKKLGAGYLAATVLLPRDEVMVRQIPMPGVSDRDLAAAVRFEIDSLNPYSEEEALFQWARIGKTSSVLIGITRRSVLEHYTTLFAQAGVKVAEFTFSAPAIYSAVRMLVKPPADGFVVLEESDEELEVYGESGTRPLFSARVDPPVDRARVLAISELRLPPETEPVALRDALPKPLATPADYDLEKASLSYASALAGACLLRPLAVNLLPREQRQSSSRMHYVPVIALASLLLILSGLLLAYPKYADRRYLGFLQFELHRLEPEAGKAMSLDRQTATTRNRAQILDSFRRRTKEDLDAFAELTKALPAPTWLNSMTLTRDSLTISGETDQAATLLKILDSSRQFKNSSFAIPIARGGGGGESFSIRAVRQGASQ